jgi:hypothetical protein
MLLLGGGCAAAAYHERAARAGSQFICDAGRTAAVVADLATVRTAEGFTAAACIRTMSVKVDTLTTSSGHGACQPWKPIAVSLHAALQHSLVTLSLTVACVLLQFCTDSCCVTTRAASCGAGELGAEARGF